MDKAETVYKKWINILLAAAFLPALFLPFSEKVSDEILFGSYPFHSLSILSPSFPAFSYGVPCIQNVSSDISVFSVSPITEEIAARIRGSSYPADCTIPLDSLRYLTVLHTGFDGLTHTGELIVHEQIADQVLEIFYRLYLAGYPIEKIALIDEYNADDEASMADNNTSAFCYRPIAGTDILSAHSCGLAVDINPLYNPFVDGDRVSPVSSPYDRETGTVSSPYFMTEQDLCVQLFLSFGFTWGGSWPSPKDYQHFEYVLSV